MLYWCICNYITWKKNSTQYSDSSGDDNQILNNNSNLIYRKKETKHKNVSLVWTYMVIKITQLCKFCY
ncbi:hypothetical protein NARC_130061 [Candidatus Nitrosocosmicus arcticus]|uniref:Uncharacterized protein n=1 Tax=Candidatus Nitrosocosmicus arcticus TaxID=2035267 RepID=A0A557ST00_9ARCH|nr:hypothetical protein NARC_130061 [Candidatus Nitrosocosmicus arcticus]